MFTRPYAIRKILVRAALVSHTLFSIVSGSASAAEEHTPLPCSPSALGGWIDIPAARMSAPVSMSKILEMLLCELGGWIDIPVTDEPTPGT